MKNKEIPKKMINYQKAALETGFNSLIMLQEQTAKAVDNVLKQSPWIPAQTKSTISEWASMYKKGTMDLKEAADQNYSKIEAFFESGFDAYKPKSKN
jgi:hypothetical protein